MLLSNFAFWDNKAVPEARLLATGAYLSALSAGLAKALGQTVGPALFTLRITSILGDCLQRLEKRSGRKA
jgi:hypothetical protein